MKGKKKNVEFVRSFIQEQALIGNVNVQQIKDAATVRLSEIDEILKSIQNLKQERSGLLDVLYILDNE